MAARGGQDGRGGRRKALKAAGVALVGSLLLGAGAAGWAYWHLNGNIRSVDINGALGDDRPARPATVPSASPSASPVPTGALNILVLGSDSRTGEQNQELGGGDSGGARSDTAMVVHLDAGRTAATVVSIPRDTLVERPSCPLPSGGTTRAASGAMFNTAYELGGPVCAVKTVESLTGVRMDHYVEVDFSGFADLVDALGGVTVTTDVDIDDDKSHLHLDAGTHHLDGTEALGLARTRYGLAGGSDLARIRAPAQARQGAPPAGLRHRPAHRPRQALPGRRRAHRQPHHRHRTGLAGRADQPGPQPRGPRRGRRTHPDDAGAARPLGPQPGGGRPAGRRRAVGIAALREIPGKLPGACRSAAGPLDAGVRGREKPGSTTTRGATMPRYLSLIRIEESDAVPGGPSPELIQRMEKLMEEMTKAGVLLDTAGLTPTSQGTRVHYEGGQISVTDGPFTETKEVIGGYSLLQAKDRAEAVEWTKRFLKVHEEYWTVTCEVRELMEG